MEFNGISKEQKDFLTNLFINYESTRQELQSIKKFLSIINEDCFATEEGLEIGDRENSTIQCGYELRDEIDKIIKR